MAFIRLIDNGLPPIRIAAPSLLLQADCALGPIPWLKSYSLWDLVKYVTADGVGTYHGTTFINIRKQVWAKFSEKEKQAFVQPIPKAVRIMAEVYETDDIEIKKAAIEKGVQWVDPEPSLIQAVEEFRKGDIERVISIAKSRGVKDPEPIVDIFVAAVEKWTQIVADIGEGEWDESQWDQYEAAIKAEIYDKMETP